MPLQLKSAEQPPSCLWGRSDPTSEWHVLSYGVALALIVFLTATGTVGSLSLLCGFSISGAHLWIALGITLLITHYGVGQAWGRTFLVIAVATGITVVSLVLSSFFTDYGNDVYGYHVPIVLALDLGWNPVYTPRIAEWDPEFASEVWLPWVDVHAKFHCVAFSLLYKYIRDTSAFEHTHLLMILVSFFTSAMALKDITMVGKASRYLIAALAALNPIALLHWQSGYIDGLLATSITILVLTLSAFVISGKRKYLPFIICAVIVGAGIKLSGPILVTLLAGSILGAAWLCGQRAHQKQAIAITASALAIAGLCMVNPLLTNAIEFGSPLYPFVTFGDKEAMPPAESPYPEEFNRLQRFFWAHLMGYDPAKSSQQYQIPLMHYRYLATYNHNIGGLGPLFGAFFITGTALFLFQRKQGFLLLLAIGILATVFLQPYVERGRYIPQVWLVPLFGLLSALSSGSGERRVLVAGAVAALALLNSIFVFATYFEEQWKETKRFYIGLAELKMFGGTIYRVDSQHTVATQKAIYSSLDCDFNAALATGQAKPLHRFACYQLNQTGQFSFASFLAEYKENRVILYATSETMRKLPPSVRAWLASVGSRINMGEVMGDYVAMIDNGILTNELLLTDEHVTCHLNGIDVSISKAAKNHTELLILDRRMLLSELDLHLIALPPEGLVHQLIKPDEVDLPAAVSHFFPEGGIFETFLRYKLLPNDNCISSPSQIAR